MRKTDPSIKDCDKAEHYEIRLKGLLDDRWPHWFEGLSLTREDDGTTILCGPVVDQAALYGLLKKVRDSGMSLISVIHVELKQSDVPDIKA